MKRRISQRTTNHRDTEQKITKTRLFEIGSGRSISDKIIKNANTKSETEKDDQLLRI